MLLNSFHFDSNCCKDSNGLNKMALTCLFSWHQFYVTSLMLKLAGNDVYKLVVCVHSCMLGYA